MTTNWANSGGPSTNWTNSTGPNTGYNILNPPNTLFGDTLVWDTNSISGVTLDSSRLVVTNAAAGNPTIMGVAGLTAAAQSSGKFYYEVTLTLDPAGGSNGGIAIIAPLLTSYSDLINGGGVNNNVNFGGGVAVDISGVIQNYGANTNLFISAINGANQVQNSIQRGDTIGVAVDLDNRVVYFKIVAGNGAGNFATYLDWNNNGGQHTADPSTNTGGIPLQGGSTTQFVPFVTFANNTLVGDMQVSACFGDPSGPPFRCLSTNPDYFIETLRLYNTWPFL